MSITEKLNGVKSNLFEILSYANQTTGENDSDIGDAVARLCDGYGIGEGGSGNPNYECVIDTIFEITETNETTTPTVVGTIDLSSYGTCQEVISTVKNPMNHFLIVIDLLDDYDGSKPYVINRGVFMSYNTTLGRSGSFATQVLFSNNVAPSNQQMSISGYWQNGKIEVASRHVANPDFYTVKGRYRARIFKCIIDENTGGSAGGQSIPNNILQFSFISQYDSNSSNRQTIDLGTEIKDFDFVVVFADKTPQIHSDKYGAVMWASRKGYNASTSILRPTGAFGTDGSMVVINNNGISVGGDYGTFYEGEKYHVFIFRY